MANGTAKQGVRLNPRHQEMVKKKIKSALLINRLQNHALGTLKGKMDDSQVRAANILLAKVLSDAPKVLAGDPENPLEHVHEVRIVGHRAT